MITVLFALALVAGPAPAPEAVVEQPVTITSPKWIARPSGEILAKNFPGRAVRDGIDGRGVVVCKVSAKGRLNNCQIESETPPGYGFGEAALKTSRHFQMAPTTTDGQPVEGGTVRLPLVWRLPPN